jgi:PPOX class probable F420-dependent enzyme
VRPVARPVVFGTIISRLVARGQSKFRVLVSRGSNMRRVSRSRATATAENAMSADELAAFLDERQTASLATVRRDGSVHLTPIWYRREGNRVYFMLAESRLHLRNLRRDPRATLLFEQDPRVTAGWEAGARAAMLQGPVEIVDDPEVAEAHRVQLVQRYMGEGQSGNPGERYYLIWLTPERTLAWDYSKT